MDLSSIMIYTAKTMEFVEKYNKKSNDQIDKKNLVVNTIFRFLDETTELTESELDFIKFMLDGIIESVVLTSKKEIEIRHKKDKNNKTLSIQEIIIMLHTKCLTIIKENNYNTSNILINIPVMVGMVMSLVEQFSQLNGTEKKAVINKVLKKLLKESIPKIMEISQIDKNKMDTLLKILPNLIDVLIEVSNNKYILNTVSSSNCKELLLKAVKLLSCKRQQLN